MRALRKRPLEVDEAAAVHLGPSSQETRVGPQHWHWLEWPAAAQREPDVVLLIHGTGASSHSWLTLAPALAAHHRVLAVDLPGHAGSGPAPRGGAGLPAMAQALWAWLDAQQLAPQWIVGHSAGAAVAVEMALHRPKPLRGIASINGALTPLPGVAAWLFPPMARLLALNPFVPSWFAWAARDEGVASRLLASTGSRLPAESEASYRRLLRDPAHAAGALAMMAHWDLQAFSQRVPALDVPLHLAVGERDGTVPPAAARALCQRLAVAAPALPVSLHSWPELGHLAQEEAPEAVLRWLGACGLSCEAKA